MRVIKLIEGITRFIPRKTVGTLRLTERAMATVAPDWLPNLLEKESFLQYHSYHKKVRHNHKAHGIVALALLGASEERTRKWVAIVNQLGAAPMDGDPEKEQLTEKDYLQSDKIEDYKGRNQAFYKILNHYTKLYKEKYNNDHEALIKGEMPGMEDGHILGAFHGVIQMAYGLGGRSPQVVLEGISINYQQYSPLFPDDPSNAKRSDISKFGHGKTDILAQLETLRTTPGLVEQSDKQNADDLQYRKDNHYFGVYGWGTLRYHSDRFADLADDLKFPDWFDVKARDTKQLMKLMEWLYDQAVVLYVKSESVNDFFILHGITAAWSMLKFLPYLDYDSGLRAIRAYYWGVLMVYVNQGCPPLSKTPEDFWKGGNPDQAKWDKLIQETLAEDYETHVYKVVQCCYDRWRENPHSELGLYLIAGADIARSHDFGRGMQNIGLTLPRGTSNI